MTRTHPRSLVRRLKNGAAFVGIVWALAGSFVAFELLSLSGIELVLSDPGTFGNLALSQATQDSTACEVDKRDTARQVGTLSVSAARVRAWLLGVNLGRYAQSRQMVATGSQPDKQIRANVEQLTGMLAVPPPGAFAAAQVANANSEFVSFVERDDRGTAHQLAVLYSPEACRLYKLGAFWGYAMPVRAALPGQRSIYAIEISHYARQVKIPAELSDAMIKPTSAGASTRELADETMTLTDAVTKHLRADQ